VITRRAYELLLRLYPQDYRIWFAAEMLSAFEQAAQQNRGSAARFVLVELSSVIRGAAAEWVAKITTNPNVRGRRFPDVMLMRPPGVSREQWFVAAPRRDNL
jgi:hypothetical protein